MGSMLDARSLNLTLDFCLRVGELLLSSGAGAADVTATMHSLSWHLGVRNPDIDVTFTSLRMSYQPDPEEPTVIQLRQVKQRDIDYEDLTLVDHLVSDVISGRLDLAEARAALARIVSSGHNLPRWAVTAGWGLMCAGVALMLGGNAFVVGSAFAAAICIDRLQLVMSRRRIPYFYQQAAGGGVATLLAAAAAASPLDVDPSLIVTANIIMLLAGIGFMGALQDALSGFYVTAGARLTEALLATGGHHRRRQRRAVRRRGRGRRGRPARARSRRLGERHGDGGGCGPVRGRVRLRVVRPGPDHRADRAPRGGARW